MANAGVDLRGGALVQALTSELTWAIVTALVVGKLVGIVGVALISTRITPAQLPQGVAAAHVVGGAALSGIGFTVSLLVAGLAFEEDAARDQATVGILIAAADATLPRTLDRPVQQGVDHIRGPLGAPMTLVEYGDFECPFCAKATGVSAELHARFGDDLRHIFCHLPITAVHPRAELASRAALAADQQGDFWRMHDMLFAHQDRLELEDLLGYASALDLDVEKFARALDSQKIGDRIRADVASAEASGARGSDVLHRQPTTLRALRHRDAGPRTSAQRRESATSNSTIEA